MAIASFNRLWIVAEFESKMFIRFGNANGTTVAILIRFHPDNVRYHSPMCAARRMKSMLMSLQVYSSDKESSRRRQTKEDGSRPQNGWPGL